VLALGRLSHRFAIVSEVLMVAILVAILMEFLRPQLQLRKPPPKPEIELDITGKREGPGGPRIFRWYLQYSKTSSRLKVLPPCKHLEDSI
jgi:hypothetical protein